MRACRISVRDEGKHYLERSLARLGGASSSLTVEGKNWLMDITSGGYQKGEGSEVTVVAKRGKGERAGPQT